MPRTQKLSGQKSFVKGLITSSTGLFFPDNAVTNTDNVIYDFLGVASRREGFNLEVGNVPKTVNWQGSAISSFLWHNVLGDSSLNIYVVQIGSLLYFYPLSATGAALSAQLVSSPLDMTTMSSQANQNTLIPGTGTPVVNHIGNLTGASGLNASFDNITVQAASACSVGAQNFNFASIPGTYTGYVGQNFTGNPQKVGSVIIYGSSDNGLGSGIKVEQAPGPITSTVPMGVTTTVNLRGSNTLPAYAANGGSITTANTLLGTGTYTGSALTITSTNTATAWNYVWAEVVLSNFDLSATSPYVLQNITPSINCAEVKFFGSSVSNVSPNVPLFECQYASGLGYLFVSHPFCLPFVVTYTAGNPATYAATAITIRVRDFDGLDDGLQDTLNLSTRPASTGPTANQHLYNLYNQGWNSTVINTWQTSGAGFTNTYPSNCDVWWEMKNSTGVFNPGGFVGNSAVDFGSTAAPKGRFIYDAFYIDRGSNIPSGAGSLGIVQSNYNRPATIAFFAGRVFYAGVTYPQYANSIWFSQTISPTSATLITSLGHCYQDNDPTSETFFDLLDTDGGVIKIPDCGQIYKLFPMMNGLVVFASNGMWLISGTKGTAGLGFVATDYTVSKLSNTRQLSAISVVDVLGTPFWWTNEGIYTLKTDQNTGGIRAESITYGTINPTYENILRSSKLYARGFYNAVDYTVQWLYRSTAPVTTPDDYYKYDSVLVLNTVTGAFYTFSISRGIPTNYITAINVASIIVTDTGGETDVSPTNITFTWKYLVTYVDNNNLQRLNIADMFDTRYLDWYTPDTTGQTYTSTFTSGYRLDGNALSKFQPGYIVLYSDNSGNNAFKFQSIWQYATSGASGKWSPVQIITNTSSSSFDSFISNRVRTRGRGRVMQFKVTSTAANPFSILGWVNLEGVNQLP